METSTFSFGGCTGWYLSYCAYVEDRRRYWEDALCEHILPTIDGELDNAPGKGRIERLTHDDYRYKNIIISPSNKSVSFHILLIRSHGYP